MVKPDELLLLHAILEKSDSKALAYYEQWTKAVDFEKVDGGNFRLLPILYKRLAPTGQPISHLNRLKGIYRQSLYRNSLLFHRAFSVLAELEKIGVPVILLKGTALVAAYYDDIGARLIGDVDFLVREEDVEKTLCYLKKLGWQSKNGSWLSKPVKHIHSLDLINSEQYGLDIHWRAFYQCPWDGADQELWKQTEDILFKGSTIKILNPTQQILHNCAHGVRWNAVSSIRWIVDVMKIMEKRSDSVNWDLLVSETVARNLTLTMIYTLSFLKSEFHAGIPEEVLNRLDQLPKDSRELHFFKVLTLPPSLGNIVYKKWLMHSYSMGDVSFWRKAAMFPGFLKTAFYQLPFYVRKKIREKRARRHPA